MHEARFEFCCCRRARISHSRVKLPLQKTNIKRKKQKSEQCVKKLLLSIGISKRTLRFDPRSTSRVEFVLC